MGHMSTYRSCCYNVSTSDMDQSSSQIKVIKWAGTAPCWTHPRWLLLTWEQLVPHWLNHSIQPPKHTHTQTKWAKEQTQSHGLFFCHQISGQRESLRQLLIITPPLLVLLSGWRLTDSMKPGLPDHSLTCPYMDTVYSKFKIQESNIYMPILLHVQDMQRIEMAFPHTHGVKRKYKRYIRIY